HRAQVGAVNRPNATTLNELEGGAPQKVTREVTGATSKKHISELLEVELGPGSSLIATCIRDLCLRIGAVSSITGLSVPTIYREIAQDRFPRPIKITAGARAWKLSEIMDWIETRERDPGQPSSSPVS